MKTYSFLEIYQNAKKNSPFYRELYKNLLDTADLENLPLVESTLFWTMNGPSKNAILTGGQDDGIVFKSGGTSGNAKFSYFSKEEWATFTDVFGAGMSKGTIQDKDKIANFFYAGDLYASFIFIMKSIEASNCKAIQLPLGGTCENESIFKILNDFQVNVWAGPPTTLMKIAEVAAAQKVYAPSKILFGGESFYPDQKAHLLSLFPNVKIQSIGYASVDGGHVGYADLTCEPGEHRCFSNQAIVEILDIETEKPIQEVGIKGKLYLTNLTRMLMPIIRYPVGDLGEWVEPQDAKGDRKFRILGRSEEGARVGPTTLYYDDIASFLSGHQKQLESSGFQLIIKHFNQLDQLIIRIAKTSEGKITEQELLEFLEKERPVVYELTRDSKIHKVSIEFVASAKLQTNNRTGKLKRIIDERF